MNLLHVVDLGVGQIEVGWRRGNEIPRHYSPLPFEDPLSSEDRRELRWYLEEYLQFPYGAEESHARRVEEKMGEWGEALFSQVFPKVEADPDPRAFYQEAVRAGLEQCELCVSSEHTEDTDFLNIPWELIRDPTPGRGYLAPSLGGLFRQRSGQAIQAPLEISHDEPFRILLIIARPLGEKDIPLGTVSRPMLEALRPLRPRVQLEVLRPPTFEALVKRLEDNPGFYHLVHFDGHGVFAPSGSGPTMAYGAKLGRGHLVFEKNDGTEDIINSEDLGQALATCKVPLFVLNACQSAEEGQTEAYASVAAQLVAIGAKGVVAMSYSVYADAAASFMERFYEKLVGGAPLSAAVAGGRKRLFAQPDRESVVGSLELRDWMVPTLYQQEQGYVPIPGVDAVTVAEEQTEEAVRRQKAEEACPAGRFGFIGRDYDILRLERALRDDQKPWVLLSGMGGIGKTELAFGFARWYAETGGCPGGVFAASFKEKADFGQVIGSIVGHGTDFSRLSEEKQWRYLVGYLRDHGCRLVWDNFETVGGYPEGAEPLATEEEREALSKFVKALRGGRSRVLITTRKLKEESLHIAPELIELGGLAQRDASLMAREILKSVGRTPEEFRQDPRYAELIKLLRGHPRSLEVVLPHLRNRSPAELIDAIVNRVDYLGESLEDASLTYAFHQLSEKTRKHLPLVGLFASHVHVGTLAMFGTTGTEEAQAYGDLMGECIDAAGWTGVLSEATACGLLSSVTPQLHEIHPTLPAFLRRQLMGSVGEEGLRRLDAEFVRLYAALADEANRRLPDGEEEGIIAIGVEEANFLRAMRLAEAEERWALVRIIASMLFKFYEVRGRGQEGDAPVTRLQERVGRATPGASDRDRGDLWVYLLGHEADRALQRQQLSVAESKYRAGLNYLESLGDPGVAARMAVGFHQMGIIAQERNRYEEAERWFRGAMEIRERLGLEPSAAEDYYHLGRIAQARARFEDAWDWYTKAQEVFQRHGLKRQAARAEHQLGRISEESANLNDAEQRYLSALGTFLSLGLEAEAAYEYHHLGGVALERGELDEADRLCRKALGIRERRRLQRDAASDHHMLGIIAQQRGRFDEAEEWYRKELDILGEFEQPTLQAPALGQLGLLRSVQDRPREAVSYLGKALAMAVEYGASDAAQILAALTILMQKMGETEFTAVWKEAFEGGEPPLDLIRKVLK